MIVLHTKSHSEPHKTNLANHARPGMEETRKSSAGNTPSRKRLMSPKAKGDSGKKPRLTKKQKQQKKDEEKGKEEKKRAIFGDWSEDEIEEIEEKEKLKESIANRESVEDSEERGSDNESIDDMFNFTDDHHSMDSDDDFPLATHVEEKAASLNPKPLRRRKADIKSFIKEQEQPKAKKKVYEKGKPKVKVKPSAADAISSLIKSKLQGSEQTKSKRSRRSKKTTRKAKKSNKNEEIPGASSKKDEESFEKLLFETNLPSLPKLPKGKEKTEPGLPQPADAFEENFSGSESAGTLGSSAEEQEPASPPPTRKPGILRKSSHLSIQLPTRPNGNSVVIRHESNSPTKYAAISAKAKAKQLARSAQTEGNKSELATSPDPKEKLVSKASTTDAKVKSVSSKPAPFDKKELVVLLKDISKSALAGTKNELLSAESGTNSAKPELPPAKSETISGVASKSPKTIVAPKKRVVSELEGGDSGKSKEKGEPLKSPVKAEKEEPLSEKEKQTEGSRKEREEKKAKSPARKVEAVKRAGKLEGLASKKPFEVALSHGSPPLSNSTSRTNRGEAETKPKPVSSESCAVVKSESVQNKVPPTVEETVNQQGPTLQRKDCSKTELSPVKSSIDRKEVIQPGASPASPKKPSAPQVIQLSSPKMEASPKSQVVKLVPPPILPKSSKPPVPMQSPNSKPTIITVGTVPTTLSPTKVPSSKPALAQKPASSAASKVVPKVSSNQVRLVHNPVILPKATTATVFVQKTTGPQKIMPKTTMVHQMIMPKPISRPVLLPKPASSSGPKSVPGPVLLPKMSKPIGQTAMRSPNSKPTIITVGKSTALSPSKAAHTKPAPVVQKPALSSPPSKPLVVGPTSRLGLDKPVVAGVSKPALGGISLSKPPVVPLVSPHKEPAGEKGLTVSLEPKRAPAVEKSSKAPVVKTVELPRRVIEATKPKPLTTTAVEVAQPPPPQPKPSEAAKEVPAPAMVVEAGATLGADGLAALSQLQMMGEDGGVGEEMIYLLVDDGTDPNLALENQTLYIDPNQLAAATGGVLTLGSDLGSGHMIIQNNGNTGPLVLQASEGGAATEGQVLLMMPEMAAGMVGDVLPPLTSTLGLVTSADTSGGIATLPSHPSSSLLAQVNFHQLLF